MGVPHSLILPRATAAVAAVLCLAGCVTTDISPEAYESNHPQQWSQLTQQPDVTDSVDWLAALNTEALVGLVSEALSANHELAIKRARVEELRHAVITSGADRFPAITLGGAAQRRRTVFEDNSSSTEDNFGIDLGLNWEIDIWGKLSDRQKQARLQYESELAGLQRAQEQLAANTAIAWFGVVESSILLELFEARLANIKRNLTIIESGYRQGINDALDVYLSRDTVAQEQSRRDNQEQVYVEAVTALQRLLARYPDGKWQANSVLPVIDTVIPVGQPSEIIGRRPDVQQAWLQLLAADAAVAAAHKERFPKMSLVGSISDASDSLRDLLNGDKMAWSVLGDISLPLFDGQRRRSQTMQARARLEGAEQQYLNVLFDAFADVERRISENRLLNQRYNALLEREKSAEAAYALSFDQYQLGLVRYTTVLESQRRAFDAQTNIVQIRNQLLRNRISLNLALGGEFIEPPAVQARESNR